MIVEKNKSKEGNQEKREIIKKGGNNEQKAKTKKGTVEPK